MKWIVKRNKTGIIASNVMGLGYWGGYFLAFSWGAFKLAKGKTTFGTLTAFLQLVGQVQGPFMDMARTLPQFIAVVASTERIIEIENLESEEKFQKVQMNGPLGIKINDLDFSYSSGKKVLDGINMIINPGEVVALIGTSGEGKTTLIRLLLALVRPSEGTISVFSKDGAHVSASSSTRDLISYVPQGNTLISGKISDNIRFGRLDATDEDIINAAKSACAWEFICELKEGMNTVIGERSIGLSEGQAQRIAIARALLRNTPIMILDEATSALDVDTEMRIINNIQNLEPKRTCLIITHRLSLLEICSRIVKLKAGKLAEIDPDHVSEYIADVLSEWERHPPTRNKREDRVFEQEDVLDSADEDVWKKRSDNMFETGNL